MPVPVEPAAAAVLERALRLAVVLQSRRLPKPLVRRLRAATRLALTDAEAAALEEVGVIRRELAEDERVFPMRDYGAGPALARPRVQTFAGVYRRAAVRPVWGRLLFRLVRTIRPRRVLELGTNLGVGACTLAAACEVNGQGRLATIEGDPTLAERARAHLRRVPGGARATVVTGTFDDALPAVLPAHGPFDLVFLDGHHEQAATRRYWSLLRPHLAPGAWVVFDDTEPWRGVRAAWQAIREEEPAAAVDFLKASLLVMP